MERSLQRNGFSQRFAAFFHAPGTIVTRTRQFMTEFYMGNIKDLPRSRRAKILTGDLENLKQAGPVYDETMNVVLWEAMNSTYGSDAVADVARLGLITKRFVISSTKSEGRDEVGLSEDEAFEVHLRWLEENGKHHGWKQDEVPQKTN